VRWGNGCRVGLLRSTYDPVWDAGYARHEWGLSEHLSVSWRFLRWGWGMEMYGGGLRSLEWTSCMRIRRMGSDPSEVLADI